MCSRQATILQGMRSPQESSAHSVRALQDEKKMGGVREAKEHSTGRGRGARYLTKMDFYQIIYSLHHRIYQPGTDTSTRGQRN